MLLSELNTALGYILPFLISSFRTKPVCELLENEMVVLFMDTSFVYSITLTTQKSLNAIRTLRKNNNGANLCQTLYYLIRRVS